MKIIHSNGGYMKLAWAQENLNRIKIRLPVVLDKDVNYLDDLEKKYKQVISDAKEAGADDISLTILENYKNSIIQALNHYYRGDREGFYNTIKSIISDIGDHSLAASRLEDSLAFPGNKGTEIQFFRARKGNPSTAYTAKDMLHLPKSLRSKSGNYRFSIPGNPSLYLCNTSYGCWIETGFLPENEFNVSPVLLHDDLKIFNLAITLINSETLHDCEDSWVHCWLKLYMLAIATSYIILEEERTFKSEYIISQAVMVACKKLNYDGIAYFSKRVANDIFALCAINLALFVDYEGEYSSVVNHMIMNDSFNYKLYKQLYPSANKKYYQLRTIGTRYVTNIAVNNYQFHYGETEFCDFDKFLFSSWNVKPRDKKEIKWGVSTKDRNS